ncbi:MAG: Crp/Fnr family transcriptional regulator, partial [Oscillospiraceae bacterium]
VKKGHIRVYMLSDEGREITLFRLFDGETCVFSASCVLSDITFDVFIDAEDDTQALLLKSSYFNKLLQDNIYVQNYTYKLTVQRFSDVMWAMQQVLFTSFDKRLAIFLLDELESSSTDEVKLTHEQIAKYMGSAREVVSRMLKYFENDGIVKIYRGGVKIIDKEKLRQQAQ